MTAPAGTIPVPRPPMLPHRYRVNGRWAENADTATLAQRPVDGPLPPSRPGQFSILYAFGVGEVRISVSGIPSTVAGALWQSGRAVGADSRALHDATPGTVPGFRGPYGTVREPPDTAG